MTMKRIAVAAGLAALFCVSSCKKTPEAEAKSWVRNTTRAQELCALYPGFTPAIKSQQALAQAAMDAAKAISNPEEAARKMSDANGLLSGGFVGGLSSLDDKVRKVREKIAGVSASANPGPEQAATQTTLAEAQRVLSGVEATLKQGATEPVGAAALVRKMEADLSSVTSSLDTLLSAAKKRQEAAKTPQAAAVGTESAAAAAAPKAESWKCSYCGRQNEGSGTKCTGCGAPKKG